MEQNQTVEVSPAGQGADQRAAEVGRTDAVDVAAQDDAHLGRQDGERSAQREDGAADGAQDEAEGDRGEPQRAKSPEERERARLLRSVDRRTRQLYQTRAALEAANAQLAQLQQPERAAQPTSDEPLTLSRADFERAVRERAEALAPQMRERAAEAEQRTALVGKLEQAWGAERFNQLSQDLDDAMGGLADAHGRPRPAMDAIFAADDPAAVIEHLADPENSALAERLARLNPVAATREVVKLEAILQARAQAKRTTAPSKAPAPLEPVRSRGSANAAPDPADTKAWIRWANEQEQGRA